MGDGPSVPAQPDRVSARWAAPRTVRTDEPGRAPAGWLSEPPPGHGWRPRRDRNAWPCRGVDHHLQFYTPGTIASDLLPLLADLEDTFVIDHMGYLAESDPEFDRLPLAVLAQGSCWIKLSGAYRVAKNKPLSSVAPWDRALVAARPDRLIWGSDEADRRTILIDGPARLFFR